MGPDVGLELHSWRRDEDAWEDWSSYRGTGRICPDAYAEVHLDVDGEKGAAGAFIEADFATTDQARLRAKVARHRRYCTETIWWDRHPCCPALLLVTTSEARVNRFLAGVERDRPDPPPTRARTKPTTTSWWRRVRPSLRRRRPSFRPSGAKPWGTHPITLSALLAPEVRQYCQAVARVEAAQHQHDEYRRHQLVHGLHCDAPALADAVGDEKAAAVIRYLFAGPLINLNPRERWGLEHLNLAEQTASWWAHAKAGSGLPALAPVLSA